LWETAGGFGFSSIKRFASIPSRNIAALASKPGIKKSHQSCELLPAISDS
jgi:hypothetical protein